MKTIMTSKFNAEEEAKRVFESAVPFTDNLEVIDALIKMYPNEIQFRQIQTDRILPYDSAHTCRYELGHDIR